jgi:hypothetical protein
MMIQSEITNEDWAAYVQFIRSQLKQNGNTKTKRWSLVVGLGFLVGFVVAFAKISIDPLSILIGSFGMAVLIQILTRTQMRAMKPLPDGVVLGPCSINIDDGGIKIVTPNCETFYRWKTVRGTKVTDNHIFVFVDSIAAITIPRRAFNLADEQERFLSEIQEHVGL